MKGVKISLGAHFVHMFLCVRRNEAWRMEVHQLIASIPELHLNQTELPEVCAQLKGPEYGVLLGQHDQRGARQAAVDVQPEPDGDQWMKRGWQTRWSRWRCRNKEQGEAFSPVAVSFVELQTDAVSALCGRLHFSAVRIKTPGRGRATQSELWIQIWSIYPV